MMSSRTLQVQVMLHLWSSVACTVFLLLLCFTGLPLIFHDEIAHWGEPGVSRLQKSDGRHGTDLDAIAADAQRRRPGEAIRFLSVDEEGETVHVFLGVTLGARENSAVLQYDGWTGGYVRESPLQQGIMRLMFRLHVDLFAGLPGMLFLGGMGLLFLLSLVSGVVLYGPFMRKLPFGAVRGGFGEKLRWLDLHNLLGIATAFWALVVGATGVVNTLAVPIFDHWQSTELAALIEPWRDRPLPNSLTSVQLAVQAAEAHLPGKELAFVAFPGTSFAGAHHYGVYVRGKSPLTKRLIMPVMIEAERGAISGAREMPWYVSVLKLSQPLHFGDYGGLPLKIVWALLDLVTIGVLLSGLYLWWKKRTLPGEQLQAESEPIDDIGLAPEQEA
jgi:uncharacterized iron-regulated membrane protein